jgi:hypothetical protein
MGDFITRAQPRFVQLQPAPQRFFARYFHTIRCYGSHAFFPEVTVVDAIYLLVLAALYLVTHWLVRALARLGEPS